MKVKWSLVFWLVVSTRLPRFHDLLFTIIRFSTRLDPDMPSSVLKPQLSA